MDIQATTTTINACLREIRQRLEEASSIAKAAEACSLAGNTGKGVEVVLDVEQLVYEVNTLLNAASLMKRLSKMARCSD
jgi:hypothetical protein